MYFCEDWWVLDVLLGLCLVFFIFTPRQLFGMKINIWGENLLPKCLQTWNQDASGVY